MTDKEIVKAIMEMRGFSGKSLSEKIGFMTPSGVTERLRGQRAMRCDTFLKLIEAMDCEVVVRSKLKDKEQFTLTFDDGEA